MSTMCTKPCAKLVGLMQAENVLFPVLAGLKGEQSVWAICIRADISLKILIDMSPILC